MWEHRPHERAAAIVDPVLWLPADSGDVAWTRDKRAALDDVHRRLRASRVVWFSPADHDVHAQHPDRVAAVLHDATTDGFFGGTDA
jgi:pimeloyl-ACP methyl ester carboxylesterase